MANFRLKQFAGEASNNGQFGSYVAGTKLISNDPNVIMNLPSWGTGWLYATEGALKVPRLEEMQGVQYVLCKSMIESGKSGINEYFAEETYDNGSLVKVVSGTDLKIYQSIANNNTGNPLTDTNFWREWSPTPQVFHTMGEIFTDGYVELLDGQGWCEGDVLPSGVYSGLVAEFDKYTADNNKGIAWIDFATYEATMLANNGNCVLFGYDVVNNLIRLPTIQDGVGIFQANTIAENGKFYNDQLQGHKHETAINSTAGTGRFTNGTVNDSGFNIGITANSTHTLTSATFYTDGTNGTPRVGNETRNKQIRRRYKVQLANIGVKASESQYAEFVGGLTNKADKNLGNVDLATSIAATSNVLQTLQNNVAETIAKSGWLVATGRSTSTDGKALVVTLNGVLLPASSYTGVGAAFGSISIVVAAGDVVQVVSGLLLKAEILEIKGGIK